MLAEVQFLADWGVNQAPPHFQAPTAWPSESCWLSRVRSNPNPMRHRRNRPMALPSLQNQLPSLTSELPSPLLQTALPQDTFRGDRKRIGPPIFPLGCLQSSATHLSQCLYSSWICQLPPAIGEGFMREVACSTVSFPRRSAQRGLGHIVDPSGARSRPDAPTDVDLLFPRAATADRAKAPQPRSRYRHTRRRLRCRIGHRCAQQRPRIRGILAGPAAPTREAA